jgi:hypothetical protein
MIVLDSTFAPALLAAAEISYPDLIKALEDRETALGSFSVRCEVTAVDQSQFDPKRMLRSKFTLEMLAESGGRFRFYEEGVLPKEGGGEVQSEITATKAAFNGELLREARGRPEDLKLGSVSSNRASAQLRFNPRTVLSEYQNRPILAWLSEGKGHLAGRSTIEGRTVLLLETAPVLADGLDWKQSFWIAPDLNFAAVKRSASLRSHPDGEWIEYTFVSSHAFIEPETGFFVPGKAIYRSFVIGKDVPPKNPGQSNLPLSSDYEIYFSNWKINPPVSADDFELNFETGTFVNDRDTGKSYKYNELSDADIEQAIADSRSLPRPPGQNRNSTVLIIAMNLVAGLVLATILAWRRRTTPRNRPTDQTTSSDDLRPGAS